MHNQHRILRVFQLISLLKTSPSKSVHYLSHVLEITERSVYRYIDLLKEIGFDVQRDDSIRYFLPGDDEEVQQSFTSEESELLRELLLTAGRESKLKDSILRKLYISSDVKFMGQHILKSHLAKIVHNISLAMHDGKQLILKNYHSANSLKVSDRLVEPVRFTANYQSICAYEVKSGKNKYFNIERIASVEILHTKMKHTDKHKYPRPDVFGFSECDEATEIDISLNTRAFVLMKEEYPMAIPFLEKEGKKNSWRLKTTVYSFKPITRFILGLPGDIIVTGGKEFKDHLESVLNKIVLH